MTCILTQTIADLIAARYEAQRRAMFWRDLALAAIHQLHDQRLEINRQQRQIAHMAAELRELRAQVSATTNLPEQVAA